MTSSSRKLQKVETRLKELIDDEEFIAEGHSSLRLWWILLVSRGSCSVHGMLPDLIKRALDMEAKAKHFENACRISLD
jgi:hypothetical protein